MLGRISLNREFSRKERQKFKN